MTITPEEIIANAIGGRELVVYDFALSAAKDAIVALSGAGLVIVPAKAVDDSKALIRVGAQMANVCFNVAQYESLPQRVRETCSEVATDWDSAMIDATMNEPDTAPSYVPATDESDRTLPEHDVGSDLTGAS